MWLSLLLWLSLRSALASFDTHEVRDVARCHRFVKDERGRMLFVQVPSGLVASGSCSMPHACCYTACFSSGRGKLPNALLLPATGEPLGTASVACVASPSSPFIAVGAIGRKEYPQLLPPRIARLIPLELGSLYQWAEVSAGTDASAAEKRFVPQVDLLYSGETIKLAESAWLWTQSGTISLVAARRGEDRLLSLLGYTVLRSKRRNRSDKSMRYSTQYRDRTTLLLISYS